MTSPTGNPYQANEDVRTREENSGKSYRAYILRCWAEEYDNSLIWRFSLEEIPSSRRIGFAKLTELSDFLRIQIEDKEKQTMIRKRNPMITTLIVMFPYVLLLTLAMMLMNWRG